MPPTLTIVWHSRTGGALALAQAAASAASEVDGVVVRLLAAVETSADDLLDASALIFAAPENLGALSGEMKALLDRCYYPLLGKIEGRSYAALIAAGSAGQGALAQLERIVSGWRLRPITAPLIANFAAQTPAAILAAKIADRVMLTRAAEIGATLANGLALGIY